VKVESTEEGRGMRWRHSGLDLFKFDENMKSANALSSASPKDEEMVPHLSQRIQSQGAMQGRRQQS
jgi:hypothetical protein